MNSSCCRRESVGENDKIGSSRLWSQMKGTTMVQDIVCGMGIAEDDPRTVVRKHEGKTYFFCSAECMLLFKNDSSYFLTRKLENDEVAIDLVCGMNVEKNNLPSFFEYDGRTFYFCSDDCKEQFKSDPKQFVGR